MWLTIYKHGPLTPAALVERHRRMGPDALEQVTSRLRADGRVSLAAGQLVARHYAAPLATPKSPAWGAAVCDHFEAVVTTLCRALVKDPAHPWSRATGGSTFSFDLWPGHPHEARVLAFLEHMRAEWSALAREATAFNDATATTATMRATLYFGEHVVASDPSGEHP